MSNCVEVDEVVVGRKRMLLGGCERCLKYFSSSEKIILARKEVEGRERKIAIRVNVSVRL